MGCKECERLKKKIKYLEDTKNSLRQGLLAPSHVLQAIDDLKLHFECQESWVDQDIQDDDNKIWEREVEKQ